MNTATGAFFECFTDVAVPGRGPGLSLSRSYDSTAAATAGAFGYGWADSASMALVPNPVTTAPGVALADAAVVDVVQENGSHVAFTRDPASGAWVPPTRVLASLTANADGTYTFVRRGRSTFTFDAAGRLSAMRDLNDEATTLAYDSAGKLTTVTDAAGRTLSYTWTNGLVTTVAGPLNQTVTYAYDSVKNLTAVTAPDGAVTHFGYDTAHRMTTMTTPRGGVTTNAYDNASRVVSQTDPLGKATTFGYDGQGPGGTWKVSVTDPVGAKTVETYTDSLLTKRVDAAGTDAAATTTFTYDADTLGVATVTDPLGRVTSTTWDDAGHPLSVTDPLGRVTKTTYDALGNVLTDTAPSGAKTSYTYDTRGNRLTTKVLQTASSALEPVNVAATATVTASSQNSGDGQTAAKAVDGVADGYPGDYTKEWATQGQNAGAWLKLAWSDPVRLNKLVLYDRPNTSDHVTGGRLTFSDGSTVSVPALNNDGTATPVTFPARSVKAVKFTVTDTSSSTNNVGLAELQAWTPPASDETPTDPAVNTVGAAAVTASSQNSGDGQTAAKAVDGVADGYPGDYTKEWATQGQGVGAWLNLAWDDAVSLDRVVLFDRPNTSDHVTGGTLAFSDGSTVTVPTLNDDGSATPVTFPARDTTSLRFTVTDVSASTGNVGLAELQAWTPPTTAPSTARTLTASNTYGSTAHPGQVTATTDARGKTTTLAYDAAGNLISVTDPLGHTTTATYDAAAQKTSSTTARGHAPGADPDDFTTQYTYDAAGRITAVTDPLGHAASMTYDADGNLVTSTDPAGRTTTTTYDAAGRPTTVKAADNSTTSVTYDAAGRVTTTTDAAGKNTGFTYDALGRALTRTDSLGRVSSATYDVAGQPTTSTDARGVTTTSSYDAAGQLTHVDHSDATADVSYAYDVDGRRTAMSDATGTTTYTYDTLDQLIATTNGAGDHLTYAYDESGNQTRLTLNSALMNGQVNRSYDDIGNLTGITDPTGGVFGFGYDPNGALTSAHYPNGLNTAYTFDAAGRPTATTTTNAAGQAVLTQATTLDATSRVTASTVTHPSAAPSTGQVPGQLSSTTADSYTYNTIGQLTGHNGGAYGYDAAGNLTATPTAALSYDQGDQLATLTPTGSGAATSFAFDDGGRRTSAVTGSGASRTTTTYTYDALDNLTALTIPGAAPNAGTYGYTYDGDGLRQSVTTTAASGGGAGGAASTARFVWDPTAGITELLSDTEHAYVYGPGGLPLEQLTATGAATYLTTDISGAVRVLSDATGSVTGTYGYSPYGTPTHTGAANTRLQYAGQYTDDSGLVYLRARYYDPATSQFLTVDPLVDLTGEAYTYASGDPINLSDPTGAASLNWYDRLLLSGPGRALDNVLNRGVGKNVTSFVVGFGNGATFGAVGEFLEFASPGAMCTVDTTNGWYYGGYATGMVASALTTGGASAEAGAARGGMALAREAGLAGERAAGIIKNTRRIESLGGKANYRVPDELNFSVIGEVKNVANLSYTSQLRDYVAYAEQKGLTFNLYVRGSTNLSKTLQLDVDSGKINLVRRLP